ncbi:MAG: prepilin-type N-terminal cleavage/methylation domain-containing protein [Gammaproteobacteria bacterium]|nr:prepilin-type N-terminal cleavage/methylation domain-containing protein [Gammaproteobacteria bacterium]
MKQHGFTLIELIVTLSIAAIITTASVPSFQNFIQNNRMSTAVHNFVTTLNLARSEAVKRGERVTVCKSTDLVNCTNANGWEQGWIVFVDSNGNGTRQAPGEILLRAQNPLPGNITIDGQTDVANIISYAGSGFAQQIGGVAINSNQSTLILCDSRAWGDFARAITISTTGSIRSLSATDIGVNATIRAAKSCNV